VAQIQPGKSRKLPTNGQRPRNFLAEGFPHGIYIKLYHWANLRGKYGDGFYNFMINSKESHIPSPLIMVTCTALLHALLEWQKKNGVHPKASNAELKADRPDRSNFFNYKNDGGNDASCRAATFSKLLSSPGIADLYAFFVDPWNTLPVSYRQMVYKNTLATV